MTSAPTGLMKGEKDKTPFPKITLLDYRLKFLLPLVD